jgi:hypothetical protein
MALRANIDSSSLSRQTKTAALPGLWRAGSMGRGMTLEIAARVVETTSRIRLAIAAACPEADLFARRAAAARSVTDWACARSPAPFLQRVQNRLM